MTPVPRSGGAARGKTCLHCKKAHVSCSRSRPCHRCVERGLECVDPPSRQKKGSTSTPKPAPFTSSVVPSSSSEEGSTAVENLKRPREEQEKEDAGGDIESPPRRRSKTSVDMEGQISPSGEPMTSAFISCLWLPIFQFQFPAWMSLSPFHSLVLSFLLVCPFSRGTLLFVSRFVCQCVLSLRMYPGPLSSSC